MHAHGGVALLKVLSSHEPDSGIEVRRDALVHEGRIPEPVTIRDGNASGRAVRRGLLGVAFGQIRIDDEVIARTDVGIHAVRSIERRRRIGGFAIGHQQSDIGVSAHVASQPTYCKILGRRGTGSLCLHVEHTHFPPLHTAGHTPTAGDGNRYAIRRKPNLTRVEQREVAECGPHAVVALDHVAQRERA